MFCTNCGQQIADDSVFCEHCGTKLAQPVKSVDVVAPSKTAEPEKQEVPEKESNEIKNQELKQIANHLEFLGYEIEKLDIEGEAEWVAARNKSSNNYVFHELTPDFILFQTGLRTDKKQEPAMDIAVNNINKALSLSRLYYEVQEGFVILRIESVYVGEYSKEKFARFHDLYEKDQSLMAQLEDFRAFLKD